MGRDRAPATMALDNPSYFSLSGSPAPAGLSNSSEPLAGARLTAFFRKKPTRMGTGTSASTLARQESASSVEESQPMLQTSKRSLRSLFRSVSANAASEKTLQILKGDPRPSDVAPPSPYLPHRSHSHSDHDRRTRPNRRRALRSASELLSNDMVFCGLTNDDATASRVLSDPSADDDTAEVFLGIDDARYYNLSATRDTRRHSIGTFLTKENCRNDGEMFIRQPDTVAPPIPVDQVDGPVTQPPRNRRKDTLRKSSRTRSGAGPKLDATLMEDREDVVFVSSKDSEASTLWVNYLSACFEQISRQQGRPPFKVRHVTVEDSTAISSQVQQKITRARLQIIVVCPILLERASSRPEQASALARQLTPERVLAMMLGVQDIQLTESQRTALVSYSQWRKFFVKDQDETFVGEFLGAAVAILGTATPAALKSDKTTFSVHPKKVKMGQNKVLVVLNDALRPEDTTDVIVDRCGEAIEITQVKRRNPYTLQISIPERCLDVSMLVGVRVMINGMPQGVRQVKCESRLRELDQILRAHDNPMEYMCQTFGFNSGDREQLDNWMVHAFQKNLPPRFDLLATPSGSAPIQKNISSPEEYPTLLHFAARFGLEKLAWQLLECPGGEIACDLKNVSDLAPADLAEQAGHAKLAHQLRGYTQMNEFTNMYSYLKVISENSSGPGANNESASLHANLDSAHDKEDYCKPRPLSEAYLVPPAARPIITSPSMSNMPPQLPPLNPSPYEMNYSVVPPPTPVLGPIPAMMGESNGLHLPLQGYLKMHPAGPKTPNSINAPVTAPLMALKSPTTPTASYGLRNELKDENSMSSSTSTIGSLSRASSNHGGKSREASGPQDELLEIINDFKNNVFTISEVERLVENWRNRNDVQQSFKDKQRQLAAMRDEYERIQKKLKEEMKAPTPFDRIKKFFTKGKKDSKESVMAHHDDETVSASNKTEKSNGLSDRRPISSLSLHSTSSSSSSGRMSIISGCSGTSLGDSGTHSDTEDRRLRNLRDDKGGMMTYEIPPTPKPFTGRYSPMRYTPSPRSSAHGPHPPAQGNEYYIAFPVSGLPIHAFNSDRTAIEPKTPSSPCEAPIYPSSPSIPEEQNHCDDGVNRPKEIKEINQLSVPSPPPSPPTHVPLDYINITPVNIPASDSPASAKDSGVSSDAGEAELTPDARKILNSDSDLGKVNDESKISEGAQQQTHCKSHHAQDISEFDVVDAPTRLPDYMNIQPCDQEPKVVGTILKKLPAPPVPPRAPAKK